MCLFTVVGAVHVTFVADTAVGCVAVADGCAAAVTTVATATVLTYATAAIFYICTYQ